MTKPKPVKLTKAERAMLQWHATFGARMNRQECYARLVADRLLHWGRITPAGRKALRESKGKK